jgi:O-antigen ligase
LVVASLSRGGLVAVLSSIATVVLLRPREGSKKLARVSAGIALVVATLIAFDVSIDVGDARKVSAQQITDNVLSISRDQSTDVLEGSRRWRLLWWSKIVDYTVFGEYFWTGKGFGVNLADDDGFQVYGDRSLRSPHNAHLTILARTGVPGLALWVLLQIVFATSLVRAALRAMRDGSDWWARVNVWILGYWVAFVVNGAFDVFLEGPQGGIWFWSLMGFGIAALRAQDGARSTIGPRHPMAVSRVAQPGNGGGTS